MRQALVQVVVDLEEESSDEEEFDLETYGQSVEPNPSTNIEKPFGNHAGFDNFHMKIKKFGYTKKELERYFASNTGKAIDFLNTFEAINGCVDDSTLVNNLHNFYLKNQEH